jgi:hypothetical protein
VHCNTLAIAYSKWNSSLLVAIGDLSYRVDRCSEAHSLVFDAHTTCVITRTMKDQRRLIS